MNHSTTGLPSKTKSHWAKSCRLLEETNLDIRRSSGESVLLSCSCTDLQNKPENLIWETDSRPDSSRSYVNILNNAGSYRGRVQMFNHSSPGNLSVLISDLQIEDTGLYTCWIGADSYRYFQLFVQKAEEPETPKEDQENNQNEENDHDEENTSLLLTFTFITVLVVILLLGGVALILWRNRGQKGKDEESRQHMKNEKNTDYAVYSTIQDKNTGGFRTPEDSQDDVAYSTVLHSSKHKAAQVKVETGDRTEYATIKHFHN
uniref:Ig-like domain-containing protein n=1 Tax=Denticeps clupeoides TaxID=299321 RepID=A0AAY4C4K6_9TELE